ncbi:hypothetical protein LCGC14_2132080 [marine sediment metagenome]|uniref:Uncharacterized protein n=1 Tax=marine sediment metagenome TaxID=412755 RepID=A0A0F9E144_9ZZZZ
MTDMLSVVARAICKARGHNPNRRHEEYGQSSHGYWEWELYDKEAKAAVAAHEKALEAQGLVIVPREPTDKMKMAPRARGQIGPVGATEVWQAMIAALEGKDE